MITGGPDGLAAVNLSEQRTGICRNGAWFDRLGV